MTSETSTNPSMTHAPDTRTVDRVHTPSLEHLDAIPDDDVPTAGIDPIESLEEALAAINLFIARPLRSETIVLWRDPLGRGQGMISVSGTEHPSDVLDVLDVIADARDGLPECVSDPFPDGPSDVASLVIVSVRPGAHPDPGDVTLWSDLMSLADARGIEVTEWAVIGHDIWVPRMLAGQPSRW